MGIDARYRTEFIQPAKLEERIEHHIADIRDEQTLNGIVRAFQPVLVFHLAAQPLLRRSYEDPLGTWATNVSGSLFQLCVLQTLVQLSW